MIIEEAFKTKFAELFPLIPLSPLVSEVKEGLYAIYKVSNRQIEVDLENETQIYSVNIQIFVASGDYLEVAGAIWDIITGFETALGIYATGAPIVEQIDFVVSNDNYDFDLQAYQSSVELQIFFKE